MKLIDSILQGFKPLQVSCMPLMAVQGIRGLGLAVEGQSKPLNTLCMALLILCYLVCTQVCFVASILFYLGLYCPTAALFA